MSSERGLGTFTSMTVVRSFSPRSSLLVTTSFFDTRYRIMFGRSGIPRIAPLYCYRAIEGISSAFEFIYPGKGWPEMHAALGTSRPAIQSKVKAFAFQCATGTGRPCRPPHLRSGMRCSS